MRHIAGIILFIIALSQSVSGQDSLPNAGGMLLEVEVITGLIVPNYPNYPAVGAMRGLFMGVGKIHHNAPFASFYNTPQTGIIAGFMHTGNAAVFGYQLILMPYLSLNTSGKRMDSWWFRFSLGASYFSNPYDSLTNNRNSAIGSALNWAFQAALHKKWQVNKHYTIKLGGHYLHASNGHTQLPNFGLNSANVSLALEYFTKPQHTSLYTKPIAPKTSRQLFYQLRTGIGFHELGATTYPIGGPKSEVYLASLSGGFQLKNHLKLRGGFAYRYYTHFYQDILNKQLADYIQNPHKSASNVYFFLGTEFLLGHVGFDIEGGLNLHKPYFNYFYPHFERSSNLDFWLKKLFCTQLGLHAYAINTNKNPVFNVFAAVHLNANFGQADFTAGSLGFCFKPVKKNL